MTILHRILIAAAFALTLAPAPVAAADALNLRDTIIAELHQQGYSKITVGRTLLGRTRIVAESDQFYREIVFNPWTDTILRDYWRPKGDTTAKPQIFDTTETSDHSSSDSSPSGGDDSHDAEGSGRDKGSEDTPDNSNDFEDDHS